MPLRFICFLVLMALHPITNHFLWNFMQWQLKAHTDPLPNSLSAWILPS